MISAPARHVVSARRPYWLLLALALFVAGQCLSVSHWHDFDNRADFDCALCVLSSASGAAALDSAWPSLATVLAALVFLVAVYALQRGVRRFHDSRAPPSTPELHR